MGIGEPGTGVYIDLLADMHRACIQGMLDNAKEVIAARLSKGKKRQANNQPPEGDQFWVAPMAYLPKNYHTDPDDIRTIHVTAMTAYAFNMLDMDMRAAYLWRHGDFITGVIDAQGRSNFYTLNGYYVEVELFDEREAIAAVIPFETGDRYERMIRGVDLSRLT